MDSYQTLLKSLELLLESLMRFCLKRSIKFQDFILCAKRALVTVACEEIQKSESNPSISKLSVATGLQRMDIKKLLSNTIASHKEKSISMRVIGMWYGNSQFKNTDGTPKILSCEGKQSEFAGLVSKISKEINPYTLLFDLERCGLVEKTESGLKLLSTVYIPPINHSDSLRMLAEDVSDLIAAVEANIYEKPSLPNLHLKAHYDNICAENLPEIKKWLLKEGTETIKKAQAFLSKFDKDINPQLATKAAGKRVALGIFSISDENDG